MLIVKKFGGTSVGDQERIMNVARRCAEEYSKGNDVVVVLSAMGKTTDILLKTAREINPKASQKRAGYADDHRRADFRSTDGHGTACLWTSRQCPLNAFQVADAIPRPSTETPV